MPATFLNISEGFPGCQQWFCHVQKETLEVEYEVKSGSEAGGAALAVAGNIPNVAGRSVAVGDAAAIAGRPAQVHGTPDFGVDGEEELHPMAVGRGGSDRHGRGILPNGVGVEWVRHVVSKMGEGVAQTHVGAVDVVPIAQDVEVDAEAKVGRGRFVGHVCHGVVVVAGRAVAQFEDREIAVAQVHSQAGFVLSVVA